jgi:thioredoxin 2
LLPGRPVDLTADSFDRFIAEAGLPVLVDFWADWCAPCKMMAPVFQQMAAEMGTRVHFAKVDTEAHPRISMRHHIKGIPSLILYRNGEESARTSGAMEAHALKRWLASQGIQ